MSRVEVDGVGIEYDVFGAGRPVVLLHGFPDTGRLWRHQAPMLAEAGFQVIVPDLRGYGRSDKPEAVDAYSIRVLAGDVMAILAAQGIGRAHVVGHDWGAALAWAMASFAPGHVDHLVVLSVGHPAGFMRTFQQRQKSWYMLLFQFPGVAETWLSADNWANFRNWAGHPDTDQVIAELEPAVPSRRPSTTTGPTFRPRAGSRRPCDSRRSSRPPWASGARETSPSPRRR